ncbi:hypothetical protein N7527_001458 [Penicillium freii]|uniref:Uncharacterized protein n=1 Tax=Penicillium freii TaxID=48697 RepID=A0A117NRD1_PENFR|nr:hypothetical protein N7527_001458 [Penicillium freii]KUM65418.1 hypothetical protein ACN42_g1640 [Penicillium freii]
MFVNFPLYVPLIESSNFGKNVLNPTPPVDIYLGGLKIRNITSLKRGIYLRDLGGLSLVYIPTLPFHSPQHLIT